MPDRDHLIADSIEAFERQVGRVLESTSLRESPGRSVEGYREAIARDNDQPTRDAGAGPPA